VGLSWTAPAGPPPASYHVYQGTSPGFAPVTPVTSTTGTSVTVTGLTNGTTYYFVVTAVGSDGTASGASAEASAQPSAKAVLASATGKMPKPVVVSLGAVAVLAVAAAAALTARRLRKPPRKRPPAAPPADVRAVPEPGPPSPVECHEVGLAETYVVRLEPLPAAIITTIEQLEPTS
jgi:Fibronectin type III domain